MSRPIITEHNSTTGEYIQREMTDYEWEQHQIVEARDAAKAAELRAIETAKSSTQAKLAALGLTTDDLKALGLGDN
jgi:hypothetical protein